MADDPELEAIRQRRMQELMAQQYGGKAPASAEDQQQQQEAQQAAEERRQSMLTAIMQPSARERLNRIALVKPDKARAVEDMLLNAAQRGQIGEKVSEARLIDMLEDINERTQSKTKVTIQRRRNVLEDDF